MARYSLAEQRKTARRAAASLLNSRGHDPRECSYDQALDQLHEAMLKGIKGLICVKWYTIALERDRAGQPNQFNLFAREWRKWQREERG